MPVFGQREKVASAGKGYINDPMHEYANAYKELAESIVQETGIDYFMEAQKAMLNTTARDTLKDFFVNESYDPTLVKEAWEIEDRQSMMEALFENDADGVLNEYAPLSAANPIIGMGPIVHKNILMDNVFDGAMDKAVAVSPKFTLTMESRFLVGVDGTEIDLWKEQGKIKETIDKAAPFTEVSVNVPEIGGTDVLTAAGGTSKDNLSIETYISAIKVEVVAAVGETPAVTQWYTTNIQFAPTYGEYERAVIKSIAVDYTPEGGEKTTIKDTISATMHKNKFTVSGAMGKVKAVKIKARVDMSNALQAVCSAKWKRDTTMVEIPEAIPMNTTIAPEEIKDIQALYNVNQLTKIMTIFKDVFATYKDDTIVDKLDDSFTRLAATQKIDSTYDFAPKEGYALDFVEWRKKTFLEMLDSHVTTLIQVLNDPNMTVTVFGKPDLIRKITPTEYSYSSPQNIGPIAINYSRTIYTSDNRLYSFNSSQKLNTSDKLIIMLKPRNSERIIYRVYDYQMYVSNEIRNALNVALPAIHAFERYKFVEYQPVQGRLQILNPTGLKSA